MEAHQIFDLARHQHKSESSQIVLFRHSVTILEFKTVTIRVQEILYLFLCFIDFAPDTKPVK